MTKCGYCSLGRSDLCGVTTFDVKAKEVICETQIKEVKENV
jgi:hypothetical protein